MVFALVYLVCSIAVFRGDYGGAALAAEPEKQPDKKTESIEHPFLDQDDGFEYISVGRVDPFMPYFEGSIPGGDGSREAEEILTGMRRFEPRQLTLVGIVSRGDKSVAMVEGPEGKGYMVDKGTRIGRAGVVDYIGGNRVVIKELTRTRTGEKRYNTIEMLLRRGEE